MFATKLMPKGTQVIIEEPLVSVAVPEMVVGQDFKIADMVVDIEAEFQALFSEQK